MRSLLAVCAHPDDESFGLGAVLSQFADQKADTTLLCFTYGEASTLGGAASLAELRPAELFAAAAVLGLGHVELQNHPDGHLDEVETSTLSDEVRRLVDLKQPDLVLVFDTGGITAHPDHRRATAAALAGSGCLPVLAWALPEEVARRLNCEFGTNFVGRAADELDITIEVDRRRQEGAIRCHTSQVRDNPVLARRLALQGNRESLRWLRSPQLTDYASGERPR